MGDPVQPSEPSSPFELPIGQGVARRAQDEDRAGEPACMAHLVCPSCGAVLSEGHQAGCALA